MGHYLPFIHPHQQPKFDLTEAEQRHPRYVNPFDHRNEVLARIRPGDTITTKTLDAAGYDGNTKKLGERPNPLTNRSKASTRTPGPVALYSLTVRTSFAGTSTLSGS